MSFAPQGEKRSSTVHQLKALAGEFFSAREDDAVVVNELACTEPGCPPVEKVIALLRAGDEPRQIKLHGALLPASKARAQRLFRPGSTDLGVQ